MEYAQKYFSFFLLKKSKNQTEKIKKRSYFSQTYYILQNI